jgi:hypothetical protein
MGSCCSLWCTVTEHGLHGWSSTILFTHLWEDFFFISNAPWVYT